MLQKDRLKSLKSWLAVSCFSPEHQHLLDDCLLEVYIRSNTAHDIYKLDWEIPKTVMSCKASDISQFFIVELFKWVTFPDENAPFLGDVLKLGYYLVPSIDVGPAMTEKILNKNRQELHSSTYRILTPDEISDKDGSDMTRVYEKLESQILPREMEDIRLENIPQYDPFEDETHNKKTFPQ